MDNFDKGLDDLLDMTDTEESSSSSNPVLFETNQPFVLELHELKKDEPRVDTAPLDSKIRKKKRKKTKQTSQNKSHITSSRSSVSDSAPASADTPGREEFYDANESYHALSVMEKPIRYKSKTKKPAPKPKTTKKRKSDGPSCSMFLAELTRRLSHKKKAEEDYSKNIVQTIVESITNALPVIFSKKTPSRRESPIQIETLQAYAPELLPSDTIDVPYPALDSSNNQLIEEVPLQKSSFKIPKMPLVNSEVFKPQSTKKIKPVTEDIAVNTGGDTDVASEIARHVGTLRKISLIAEEFNQKTAKNLKEIVDSVQEDLIKKLEEIQAEHGASKSEKQINIDDRHEPTQ